MSPKIESVFQERTRAIELMLRHHPYSAGRDKLIAEGLAIFKRAHPLSAKLDQVLHAVRTGLRPPPVDEDEENLIRFLWDLRDQLRTDPEAAGFPEVIEGILRDVREYAAAHASEA